MPPTRSLLARPALSSTAGPRRTTATLAARIAVVTCLSALMSVLITALVAVPMMMRTANREVRETLNGDTKLLAELLGSTVGDGAPIIRGFRLSGYDVYLVEAGQADSAGIPPLVLRSLREGRTVSARLATIGTTPRLTAGRPVPHRPGISVVLTTEPVTGVARMIWNRLWVALLAGLAAGLAIGVPLARRLTRPVRQAASAASRLTAGDRSVRLATAGPPETAELAAAINELTAALAVSESRQRDFLLSVSHDLRTPLTTIRGYAEALGDGVIEPEDTQQSGQIIAGEAKRLDRLIGDLLVLARLEAADLPIETMAVDLAQLVATTGQAWTIRYVAAGVPLRVELPPAPVWVHTDPGRLRQIIDGLLENSLRVVPPGAPVVLTAAEGAAGTAAFVEVRDGGPGLTDDDLTVAFERGELYRRYQGVRKVGNGLGLALAARLAQRLGGTLVAGHAPEGGARFTVCLPRAGSHRDS